MFTTLQKYIALAVVGVLVFGGLWLYRASLLGEISDLQREVKIQTDRAELAAKVAASATATQVVVTKTVEKIVEVKVKGDTIVKEVPVYVTKAADNGCTVTNGAVSVLNAAAANVLLPADPGGIQDRPSGVALSTITGTAAEWAGLYHQLAERYKGLREWTEKQGAICRSGAPQ